MSEDTEMMWPVVAIRLVSESGVPPDLADPNGEPMGVGDVVSLLAPLLADICKGMGIGMDVTFGRIPTEDWMEYQESVREDSDAFQHPNNESPIREGVEGAALDAHITDVLTELGGQAGLSEEHIEQMVDDLMESIGEDVVEQVMAEAREAQEAGMDVSVEFSPDDDPPVSITIEPREPSEGSEDPEAVRGPQIGSIGQDTGSSDDPEVCGCEYHPRSTYECPSCWRKRNAEWDAENPEVKAEWDAENAEKWGEDE